MKVYSINNSNITFRNDYKKARADYIREKISNDKLSNIVEDTANINLITGLGLLIFTKGNYKNTSFKELSSAHKAGYITIAIGGALVFFNIIRHSLMALKYKKEYDVMHNE